MIRLLSSMFLLAADLVFSPAAVIPGHEAIPAARAQAALVDLNSASEAELKELPGIADAYAKKIVAGRPYANKAQLVSRNIIPQATYDKIKNTVVASKANTPR